MFAHLSELWKLYLRGEIIRVMKAVVLRITDYLSGLLILEYLWIS